MPNWLDYLFGARPIQEQEVDPLYSEKHDDDPHAPERLNGEVHGFDERFGEDAQTEVVGLCEDDECDLPTDTDNIDPDTNEDYSPYELEPTEEEDYFED